MALGYVVFGNQDGHGADDSSKTLLADMWFATVWLAAAPPDVWKAYGLPKGSILFWGFAPDNSYWGTAPILKPVYRKARDLPHISRRSRAHILASFPHDPTLT